MDLKTYFDVTKRKHRLPLAAACDTSDEYLRHVAKGRRQLSTELAKKLVAHEPRLTLAELRPDIWGEAVVAAAA
ncbi:hypothetical protein HTY52_22745 [Cupriavidus taiwanensis]|uniref:hypothetical protein n=1 Tax=Cupriavidus taiwanensis TaxID=164546 RepID=UPI001571C0F1|nr:hypothetical protein [Cupriavidus taiwanensis]NSX16914.1 hypothetical protein [Cupriavidus taiwanensis]